MKKDSLNLNNNPEKPKRFQKMRKALQGIGLSIHLASKDPKKYMDNQDMGIKNYKGVVS